MDNILELTNVKKSFEGFCLRDISFALPKGFIMGFIGPNGAGKTTTIKLILNMLSPDGGQIRIFGADGTAAAKERIGVVMDQPYYVKEWTLLDVEGALSPFYRKWDGARYRRLLADFSLDPKKKVGELSRGMSMKLMVAAALSHGADLLILDEPTSGLDAVARNELTEILADFISDENRSVLFSTHITADLEKIADYITFINSGEIRYSGTKDELLERYRLAKGGLGILDAGQKERIIGYREHQAGFDGMVETSALKALPDSVVTEPVSLDEMVLRFNTRGKKDE